MRMARNLKMPIHFLMNFLMFFLHIIKIYCIILLIEIKSTLFIASLRLYGLVTLCENVDTTPFRHVSKFQELQEFQWLFEFQVSSS